MKRKWMGARLALVAVVVTLFAAACSGGAGSTTTKAAASGSETTMAQETETTMAQETETTMAQETETTMAQETETTMAQEMSYDDLGVGNATPNPALCDGGPYKFGIDTFSDTQDYAITWLQGMDRIAGELGCVEITTLVDNIDPATAVANIKTLIAQEQDGVILFQVIEDAQGGIMDLLDEAGIPAVAHAVDAPGAPFISPYDKDAGLAGGEPLGKAALAKWPGEVPWIILGIMPENGEASRLRLGGVEEGVRMSYPDLPDDHVIEVDTQATADIAFTQTLAALPQIPVGDKIVFGGINDDVVSGMLRAIEQDGRIDDTLGVGMGGLFPSGVQVACENSDVLVGTVDFLPETAAQYMIPALIGKIKGIDIPDPIRMDVKLLDKAGLHDKYPDFEPCQG